MEWIQNNWESIVSIATAAISLGAAVAAVTPTNIDNSVVKTVRKIANVVGLNLGNAKNEKD